MAAKYVYASFGKRLAAFLIDWFILCSVFSFLIYLIPQQSLTSILQPFTNIVPIESVPVLLQPFFIKMYVSLNILHMIINYAYSVYFISHQGQTIGKMLLKIQVIDNTTGKPPKLMHALIRETVGKFVSGLFLGVGFLAMLFNSKRQTWHDKMAHTVVIKISGNGSV